MNKEKPTTDAADQLAAYVHSKGGRHTPERAAVARLAVSRAGLWTCADLCASPELDAFKVSRAAVYSTVGLLVEMGLLTCHRVDGGAALYEARGPQPGTMLMVCRGCGAVKKVQTPEAATLAIMKAAKAWMAGTFDILARGLCPACRRKARQARKPRPS